MEKKKKQYKMKWDAKAFTLIEVVVTMVILVMITGTVIVVMNRITNTVINTQTKTQAFEIARENMENILAQNSVSDSLEFGQSEIYPDINWETRIESFYEPITNRMWIRAVCSAEYFDTDGQKQKIEMEHWLSSLSKKQLQQVLEQKQRQQIYERQLAELDPENPDKETDPEKTDTDKPQPDTEADQWKALEDILGPSPEGYENWGQVPDDIFWQEIGKFLSSK